MKTIFKDHSTVLFQGDSITDWGREGGLLTDMFPDGGLLGKGYAYRAAKIYELLFPNTHVTFVNRGVSGNRSAELLARYEEDIYAVQPDYISIMIGINDTWHTFSHGKITTREQYEENLNTLLERIKKQLPQTKILLIEPFLLPTDPEKEIFWEDLNPKIEVCRKLGRTYADAYLSLASVFENCMIQGVAPADISYDGVHLADLGNAILAKEYLKAWASIEK